MKDIFSDLYDRVLSFFTTPTTNESKNLAKNRLKTVLMQDRAGFSERAMQLLKDDLLESISRYLELDHTSFDLSIDAVDDKTVLNLTIPVLRPKTDEEIDEILSIEHKAKIEKTQEIVGELQELVKEKAQILADKLNEDDEDNDEDENDTDEDTKSNEINEETKEDTINQEQEEKEPQTKEETTTKEEKPSTKKSKKQKAKQ